MAIKTQSAKAKGRKLQQWAAKIVTDIFGLEEDDVQSRSMGASGEDLMMSPLARKTTKLSVECKNTASIPAEGELKQAEYNAPDGTLPVVVWKRKGGRYEDAWMFCRFKDFLKWSKDGEEAENNGTREDS